MILVSSTIYQMSCKWYIPTDSTIEEEYVGYVEEAKEIVWIRKILKYLQEKHVNYTPLLVGNNFTIKLAKNPRFHDQTKHTSTKYHLI